MEQAISIGVIDKLSFKKIWVIYFFIKVFYMFFAVFVFSRLTTLGDTFDYLHTPLHFQPSVFYSSTSFMQFSGGLMKLIFKADVLACIPFMLLSFYGIYYAVDRLNLYCYSTVIILLFSVPNFAVWTSILGKEAVGSFFCCVIAVMLIKSLHGRYRLKLIDYVALYLCFVFKPQYLLFIVQAMTFIFITNRFKDKRIFPLILGLVILIINVGAVYYLRDVIDGLAKGMAIHFKTGAQSTRSEQPWTEPYGFFRSAPYGMFIAFFGPTFSEMLNKPAQLLAGIESIFILTCFTWLLVPRIRYIIQNLRFNPIVFAAYLIIFLGILFIHYPFGFLNPGSAIRYRANFYPLFVLLALNQLKISQLKYHIL